MWEGTQQYCSSDTAQLCVSEPSIWHTQLVSGFLVFWSLNPLSFYFYFAPPHTHTHSPPTSQDGLSFSLLCPPLLLSAPADSLPKKTSISRHSSGFSPSSKTKWLWVSTHTSLKARAAWVHSERSSTFKSRLQCEIRLLSWFLWR